MGKISQPVISSVDVDLLEFLRIRKTVFVWWVSKRTAGAGAWAGNNEQQTSSHRLGHVRNRFYNARTIWVLLTFTPLVILALSSATVAAKEPIKSFAECSS